MELQTFTAEREWTVDGIPVLSTAIELPEPVPAADKFSRRVRRYYQLQCRASLQYCEKHLFPQLANRPLFNVLSAGKPRRLGLPGGLGLQWSL